MEDPLTSPFFANARKFSERSYTTFIKNLNNISIQKYFNIDFLDITLLQCDALKYKLRIEYTHTYPYLIKMNLPYDIIKLIKSYGEKRFICVLNIIYTKDTPFKAPIWSPIYIKTFNYNEDALKNIIKRHNIEYLQDWSPAILLEKDILYFIERLIYNINTHI